MRLLPRYMSEQQKLTLDAVGDFYNIPKDAKIKIRLPRYITEMALWIMGRKKGVELTKDQLEDIKLIQANLGDKIYRQSLLQTPHFSHNEACRPQSQGITPPNLTKYLFKKKGRLK